MFTVDVKANHESCWSQPDEIDQKCIKSKNPEAVDFSTGETWSKHPRRCKLAQTCTKFEQLTEATESRLCHGFSKSTEVHGNICIDSHIIIYTVCCFNFQCISCMVYVSLCGYPTFQVLTCKPCSTHCETNKNDCNDCGTQELRYLIPWAKKSHHLHPLTIRLARAFSALKTMWTLRMGMLEEASQHSIQLLIIRDDQIIKLPVGRWKPHQNQTIFIGSWFSFSFFQ